MAYHAQASTGTPDSLVKEHKRGPTNDHFITGPRWFLHLLKANG
jgi:hypothetical protein